jgi:dTDP-4-dehydrorhamnose reductase
VEVRWCSLRVLVTGASGLLGSKLVETAERKGHEVYSGDIVNQPPCGIPIRFDISDKKQVDETFDTVNPDAVVHCAAMTDVDKCETERDLARKINVVGTEHIVEAAKRSRAFLIYVSTDFVFDGKKGRYDEEDTPDPINYYGLTKVEAERRVQDLTERFCVVRASVIFGSTPAVGKVNFALWLLDKLKRREQVNIVTDQWNSPTLNSNMAEMTLEILERKLEGIIHVSGATRVSRYDFAKLLAQTFELDSDLIKAVSSADFSWPANRPRDSSLSTTKARRLLKNKPLEISQAFLRLREEIGSF